MNVEAPERFESFKRFELLKNHQFTSKTQSSKRQKPTSSSQVPIVLIGLTSYLVVNNPCCRYYLSCRQHSYGHQHLSCRQTPILLLTIPSIPPFKNFPHARPYSCRKSYATFIAFHLILLHVRNSRPCYRQCIILASS
jgi:hypothetical protein